MTQSEYRVDGELPMLVNDIYTIAGCPFAVPFKMSLMPCPCFEVRWMMPSNKLFVKGNPVLTNFSSGFCHGGGGFPQGSAILTSFQMRVQEPEMVTHVE